QAADAVGRGRGNPEPVPALLDHLAEGADGETSAVVGEWRSVADQVAGRGWSPLPCEAHGNRRALERRPAFPGPPVAVHDKADAARVVAGQDLGEARVQQRLEVTAQRRLEEARVQQR